MTAINGNTRVDSIALTAAELASPPSPFFLTNPERWDFYDVADVTSRYRISGGVFLKVSSAIDALQFFTNPAALAPIARALAKMVASEVIWTGVGDSITTYDGTVSAPGSDVRSEKYGWLAQLRQMFSTYYGTPDGGCFIGPDVVASESRVAVAGAPTYVSGFGPFFGFKPAGSDTLRKAASLAASPDAITFTFTGRYCNVLQWENAASSYNGTYSYAIDGGSAVNVTSSGAQDTFRVGRIDCGTYAQHTVTLTWVSAKVLIGGVYITNGSGLSTIRFSNGGATTYDPLNQANPARVITATFKTLPSAVFSIGFSHNDANKQTTGPWLTTPAAFGANLDAMIAAARLNPSYIGTILIPDPVPSPSAAALWTPAIRADYITQMKQRAVGDVAFLDVDAAVASTYANAQAVGYMADTLVHPSELGNRVKARVLFDGCTSRSHFSV